MRSIERRLGPSANAATSAICLSTTRVSLPYTYCITQNTSSQAFLCYTFVAVGWLVIAALYIAVHPATKPKHSPSVAEQQSQSQVQPTTTFIDNRTCAPDQQHSENTTQWYASPEWWLAILGFPTIFIIGWQAVRTADAAQAAKVSAEATQSSVTLQEVSLRQWVDIENWKACPYMPEGGDLGLHVQFDVVNPTNLPLTLNSVYVVFACHGCSDQGGKIGRKNLVPPSKSHPVVTWVKLTEEQLLKWEDLKELVFVVNGTVEFEDVLKEVRNQPFSGLIACSKKGGVRFIPPYGSGLYITDKEKKSGDPN
jgi:hypothetical protein